MWAIVSWLFVGHGAFLLIGTTTFASVVLLVANSLQIQEFVAGQIGRLLTRSTGLQVVFGSAEPNWRDGKLSFRDVQVVCGPPAEGESDNYTRFDLRMDRFDVNISLARMLEGRGLARSCVIEGLRGTVDRRFIRPVDGWRYEAKAGDFELDSVSLRDVQVEVLSADFRPFSVSVIHAELPRLRKRLLLYDLLCTESAVGVFDRSLFSVHMPTSGSDASAKRYCEQIRHLKVDGVNADHFGAGTGPLAWLQKGAIDIDAVLQLPSSYRRPSEDLLDSLNETLGNIKENVLISILDPHKSSEDHSEYAPDQVTMMGRERLLQFRDAYLAPLLSRLRKRLNRDVLNVDEPEEAAADAKETASFFLSARPNTLSFRFDLRLRNIRAHIPLQNDDLGIVSTAIMAKPIVAYINEHRPYIPLACRFQLDLANFDGAWTVYESGIAKALGEGVNDSLAHLVADKNKRLKRLKRVGLWSMYAAIKNMRFIIGANSPFGHLYN